MTKPALPHLNKKDISLLMGNALDQFETALYGFLTPLLSPIFFPDYDPIVQLILGYSILATGLITRPIGAFLFGGIAKKYGPNFGLSYSILGVAMTTIAIAFLPGFSHIGWLAPCTLLILRILKGLFGAGECTIARLSILEEKKDNLALRTSYYYETSTMFGIIIASLAATLTIELQDHFLAWRYCFLLGGVVGIMAYYIRQSQYINNQLECERTESYPFSFKYTFFNYKNLWQVLKARVPCR